MWPEGNCDRFAYLGHAMTYAVGNPFGEDPIYKNIPTMLSPIYPYLVALLHRISGFSLIKIYNYGSLLWTIFIPLVFYLFRPETTVEEDKTDKKWEGLLMACFALYLSSDIQDLRFFREDFWNLLVLLKPSHSLSFILIPVLYFFLGRVARYYNVLAAGVVLSLIISSWFVTGIFLICSFVLYLIFIYLLRKKEFSKICMQVVVVILIGLVLSSWYWLPFFTFKDIGSQGMIRIYNYEKYSNLIFDPFEATFFMIPLFWFSIVGIYKMFKRRTKWDLLILGLIASMYLGKLVYPLSQIKFDFSPQAFECSIFFIRFSMGLAAGIGFYTLAKILTMQTASMVNWNTQLTALNVFFEKIASIRKFNSKVVGFWVALGLIVISPYLVPIWEVPILNSKWYIGLKPIPKSTIEYTDWIKYNT
jgi:hypothetical protein